MERIVEAGQPGPSPIVASSSPARAEIGERTVDETSPRVGAGSPAYSFWAECECPGDCLRDHANE
jgi:hypothetical protein